MVSSSNRLILGDCLYVLRNLDADSINLIYIDPPFYSKRNYSVSDGGGGFRQFHDTWSGGLDEYIQWLRVRILEMHRVLKPEGSIYVHCDWHASHYIKIEMDKIFGYDNFRNEIIWRYGLGGFNVKRWFPRKHDVIFYYSKSKNSVHNKLRGKVSRWMDAKYNMQDENGRYFLQGDRRYYLKGGKPVDSVWDEDELIEYTMSQTSGERVRYPTQKPEALLERIITASSQPGDVIGDFFVGSGTSAAVAVKLDRRFIACDLSRSAIDVSSERLKPLCHANQFTLEEST